MGYAHKLVKATIYMVAFKNQKYDEIIDSTKTDFFLTRRYNHGINKV